MEKKSIRIKADLSGEEKIIKVKLNQNFDTLDILSLKIDQKNTYTKHSSNYGILIGRVIANDGFGVPNAKVSVFIPTEEVEADKLYIYPYTKVTSTDENNVRYNLLQSNKKDECTQNVGTFPDKRTLLDNNITIELFDKYYKFTASTNQAGDYMIYGIPVGNQKVHVDIDLSDIGVLSQSPRDMIYQGYSVDQFESYNKFKSSTNLDNLPQIISQDSNVYIYPFTGDEENDEIGISRHDVKIQYKFQPTCVFMGSIFGDTTENSISKDCVVDENAGSMGKQTTGTGRIEMIRKTVDNKIELYNIQNTNLIDSNGTWLYQIPMNLDYMITDEYGNMKPSDDISKGIPTRTDVRFRIQLDDYELTENKRRASYLIPNNPKTEEESDYEFGINTSDNSFVSMLWNKVYTVKNYIPKFQQTGLEDNYSFLGIKGINYYEKNNPVPFNNIRIQSSLTFMFSCIMYRTMFSLAKVSNNIISKMAKLLDSAFGNTNFTTSLRCTYITSVCGYEETENYALIVGCDPTSTAYSETLKSVKADGYVEYIDEISSSILSKYPRQGTAVSATTRNGIVVTAQKVYEDYIKNYSVSIAEENIGRCYETQLAKNNGVLNYDFYNDWLNGSLYTPIFSYNKTSEKDTSFCGNGIIRNKNLNFSINQPCSLAYSGGTNGYYNKIYKKFPYDCSILINSGSTTTYGRPRRGEDSYSGSTYSSSRSSSMGRSTARITRSSSNGTAPEYISGRSSRSTTVPITLSSAGYLPNRNCFKQNNTYIIPTNYSYLIASNNGYYYYRSSFMTDNKVFESNSNKSVIALATDIVLLGSLNSCDLDGIPKISQQLPSTTYNMPPEKPVQRFDSDNGLNYITTCDDVFFSDFSDFDSIFADVSYGFGTVYPTDALRKFHACYADEKITLKTNANIEITGQDWVDDKIDTQGLFVRRGCVENTTKYKSCINASRICELGVGLDSFTTITSLNENGDEYKINSVPDGFITSAEIKNNELRSVFSTLNYNGLKTKLNEDGRVIYDIKYNYLTLFDGRLNDDNSSDRLPITPTTGDYNNELYRIWNYDGTKNDNLDEQYYLYRFGGTSNKDSFYIHSTGEVSGSSVELRMIPRYSNSFYFYFGLVNGNSVINKFNSTYLAKCEKSSGGNALGVSIDNTTSPLFCRNDGSITFSIKDGNAPYTISFRKNDNESEYIVNTKTYEQSYTINNIEKGEYILNITDINNKESETNITMSPKNKIKFDVVTTQVSTENGGTYNIVISNLENAYETNNNVVTEHDYTLKLVPIIDNKEGLYSIEKTGIKDVDTVFDSYTDNSSATRSINSGVYKLYVYDKECSNNLTSQIITLEDVTKLTFYINNQTVNNLINSGYLSNSGMTVTNDISLFPEQMKIYNKNTSRLSLNAVGGVPPYIFSIKGKDIIYNSSTLSYESGSTYNTLSQILTGERIGSNTSGVDLPVAEGISYNFITEEKDNMDYSFEVNVTDSNTSLTDIKSITAKIRLADLSFGEHDSVWSSTDKSLTVRFKNGSAPYLIKVINPVNFTTITEFNFNPTLGLDDTFVYNTVTYNISGETYSSNEYDVPYLYSVKIKSPEVSPTIKQLTIIDSSDKTITTNITIKEITEYPIPYN